MQWVLGPAVALLLLASCRDGDGETMDVTPEPSEDSLGWRVEVAWILSSLDGRPDQEFSGVTELSLGPTGRVYVLQMWSSELRIHEGDGRWVRTVGGPGQGPTEFNDPIGMAWDGHGRLWVSDALNHSFKILGPDGELLGTRPLEFRTFARIGGHRMGIDRTGGVLHEGAWNSQTGFLRFDSMGAVPDTLPPLPRALAAPPLSQEEALQRALQGGQGATRELRPFRPRIVLALAPDAESVWFARSNEYRIFHRSLDGDTLAVAVGAHRALALTSAEEAELQELLATANVSAEAGPYGRQWIRAMHVLDDGHLLVQLEETHGEDGSLFDVFAPDGRYRGELRFPEPLESGVLPGILGDTIVAAVRGELGVLQVARYHIRRTP